MPSALLCVTKSTTLAECLPFQEGLEATRTHADRPATFYELRKTKTKIKKIIGGDDGGLF